MYKTNEPTKEEENIDDGLQILADMLAENEDPMSDEEINEMLAMLDDLDNESE